jgi:hypothetical protein
VCKKELDIHDGMVNQHELKEGKGPNPGNRRGRWYMKRNKRT